MKKLIVLTAACALTLPAFAVYAEQAHHPEQKKAGGDMPAQGMGDMMEKMQQRMKKMMQQMQTIQSTDDPEKRDKLLQEHMQSMHEGMQMMRGMGGGMMKGMMDEGGGGMMKGMMGEGGGGMMEGMMGKGDTGMMKCSDKDMRHRMLEQRMDMMQMMMEQMMQHQAAERPRKYGRDR